MTASSFCEWVNNELLPASTLPPHFPRSIFVRTATRWLHRLEFRPTSHKMGVHVDGHERDDVVAVTISHNDVRKNVVLIFHDESIFNTNEGQTWIWGIGDQSYVHSAQDQRSRNHGQRFYNSKHWIPPTE